MKKQFVSILFALCMVLCLVPPAPFVQKYFAICLNFLHGFITT